GAPCCWQSVTERIRATTGKWATPAPPIGEAGVWGGESLQWDPNSEEVEAELVELRVPERRFLVAPIVDRPVVPRSTGRRKRPVPCRSRWLAGTPRCGSVPPRSVVEVAAVVIAVPWAAGTTGASRTVATRSTGSVIARAAWSAGTVIT